jgi:hypothetical protein
MHRLESDEIAYVFGFKSKAALAATQEKEVKRTSINVYLTIFIILPNIITFKRLFECKATKV